MTRIARFLRALRRAPRDLLRRQDGSAQVEFVIMVPLLFSVFFMGVEAGVLQMRQVMLDRALDLTIRDLRLGRLGSEPQHDEVRRAVCDHSFLIPNCNDNLALELTGINLEGWAPPQADIECVDRELDIMPVNTFTQAGNVRPTLVRACLIVDLIFPTSRLGLRLSTDSQGGFRMIAASFYINEPGA